MALVGLEPGPLWQHLEVHEPILSITQIVSWSFQTLVCEFWMQIQKWPKIKQIDQFFSHLGFKNLIFWSFVDRSK